MTYLQKEETKFEAGMFDFEIITSRRYHGAQTVSTGVFQWKLSSNGKRFLKSGAFVRVSGYVSEIPKINEMAVKVRASLQRGDWGKSKSIKV